MERKGDSTKRLVEITALTIIVVASAALALVLTWLPCYATICSEDYFTFETRLHIAIFYGFLAITGLVFIVRAYSPRLRSLTGSHLLHELPIIGRRLTLGGLITFVSILALVGGPTVFWLPAQEKFWGKRADPLDWVSAKIQLTITGVSGHYADILLGLLLIPVSRNSLVGHAFHLHQSTLLLAHKLVSYLFSISVAVHGITYILYATDESSEGDASREEAFATGNPAMTLSESKERSAWFTQTTYTGIGAFLPILSILATSIPWVRRRHYNVFYYSHVFFGTTIVVGSCVHASTDFYAVLPGLCLWIVDLTRRFFFGEYNGLARKSPVTLENAGNGWLRISLPSSSSAEIEPALEKGGSIGEPLLYYHINVPAVSKLQNHAFTAAIPSSSTTGPVFLLRRTAGKSQKKLNKEWTWRLGDLVADPMMSLCLNARVEGPYPTNDDKFRSASHIICIVGGTGLTGACSLAHWWLSKRCANSRFTLIWTIRHRELAMLKEWMELEQISTPMANFTMVAHVTSESGRISPRECIEQALRSSHPWGVPSEGQAWVYSAGPSALLSATQHACVEVKRSMGKKRRDRTVSTWTVKDLSWYMARWEV